jgi:hypothetical protein
MTDDLELHDSWVELSTGDGLLTLRFCPGYIHHWERRESGWVGEGRRQGVDVIVVEGTVESTPIAGPFELSGGEISLDSEVFGNMIPVPIERSGVVHGRLESIHGDVVTFAGRGLSAHFAGAWEFVEELPGD